MAAEPDPGSTPPPAGLLHVRAGGDRPADFGPVAVLDGGESEFPHVAAHDGAVHVVWNSDTQPREVRYRRSPDRGRAFAAPVAVSANPGDSSESDLAVGGGRVLVAWEDDRPGPGGVPDPCCQDDEVLGRMAADGGGRFGRVRNLSATRRLHSRDPALALSGRRAALVYEDAPAADPSDVWIRVSDHGGTRWGRTLNLSGDADDSAEPAVAVAGNDIHVVYEDRGAEADDADDRLAYVRSTDGGRRFDRPVLLAPGAERGGVVAVSGDTVHVAGCRESDDRRSELFYYRSPDRGQTWEPPVDLSQSPGTCHKPAIAAARNDLVVVWQESTPAASGEGQDDVFLRRSADGGRRFARAQNLSASAAPSEDPAVAVDRSTGDTHVVWVEG